MRSLKNKYKTKNAVLIFGGPSCLKMLDKLHGINRDRNVIFLETKALTPLYFNTGPEPDFFFLPYPEKAKDNSLQNMVYQSLKVNVPIKYFIKSKYHSEADTIINQQEEIFEEWNPKKGPHKRIRHKADIYLKDSPMELLLKYNKTSIITIQDSFTREFPNIVPNNRFHFFKFNQNQTPKEYTYYINPTETGTEVVVNQNSYTNSASICFFPLLHFMGFRNLYFIGFDMSVLGILEYNCLKTFKSVLHYRLFSFLIRNAIRHGNYKINLHPFLRPRSEFYDIEDLLNHSSSTITRIKADNKYVGKIKGMKSVELDELFI